MANYKPKVDYKETILYGLAEGVLGTHVIDKDVKEVLGMLPKDVQYKCCVKGNTIRAYSPCDG